MIRRTLLSCALVCVLGGALGAAPISCPTSSLATYLQPGFSCTEGYPPNGPQDVFTFKNFFFQAPPAYGLNADQITVIPIAQVNSVALQFLGNFSAGPVSQATYLLNYFIDPPPTIIVGERDEIDPATLVTIVCQTSASPCPAGKQLGTLTVTSASPVATILFPATNMIGLLNTLTLSGTGPGANGFTNTTLLNLSAAVPEPNAAVLTGAGLVGLLAFRSRAKLRQVFFQLRS